MVSRLDPKGLLELLRGVSPLRLLLAVIAVWALTPVAPASPLATWALAIPLGLAGWYGLLTALAWLYRALPAGTAVKAAWTAVGCGSLWIVALVPAGDWLFAFPALCAAAFAGAGVLRRS